jgi:hypothetical protein
MLRTYTTRNYKHTVRSPYFSERNEYILLYLEHVKSSDIPVRNAF